MCLLSRLVCRLDPGGMSGCLCIVGGSSARFIGESSTRRSLQQASAQCGNQGYIIGESYCVTIGELCRLLVRERCMITQRSYSRDLQHAALLQMLVQLAAAISMLHLCSSVDASRCFCRLKWLSSGYC